MQSAQLKDEASRGEDSYRGVNEHMWAEEQFKIIRRASWKRHEAPEGPPGVAKRIEYIFLGKRPKVKRDRIMVGKT